MNGRATVLLPPLATDMPCQMLNLLLIAALPVEPPANSVPPPVAERKTELVISSPVPTDFKPDEEGIDRATKRFDTFWNLYSARNFSAAYAMLSAKNRAEVSEADWTAEQNRSLDESGVDRDRTLLRITWYPDPPSAGAMGLYTALDFIAYTQKGGMRCGYIVLFNDGTDPAIISRVDTTILPADVIDGDFPRPDILPQLPCYMGPDVTTAFGKANQ